MPKRGYNWKARQVADTIIDDSNTKKIKLDLDTEGSYDQSNQLVLPSERRKTKVKNKMEQITRILSKKQRRRLEKIVEKKEKKLERAELLEKLSKVQATPEETEQLTSIVSVQTKGLKKLFAERRTAQNVDKASTKPFVLNSIKGWRKFVPIEKKPETRKSNNPNVVDFLSSSSDDSTTDSDETGEDEDDVKIENKDDVNIGDKDDDKIEVKNDDKIKDEVVEENKGIKKDISVVKAEVKTVKATIPRKPAVFVEVNRTDEIQKCRLKLPILSEEQQIMEAIAEYPIVIIAGETGSGKTTQVPQFLYEAGYALEKMIGITEPRRVAAISMSKRVSEEMNLSQDAVSYLIRFEGNVTEDTKIKFMTDGVLFRELKDDFLLTKYSVIILDEAHERSVFTDVLIGMLSRIVSMRAKRNDPLKMIIMSATLRLEDFTENKRLFNVAPPVIKVEARQFSVSVHFNRVTNENYLKEALKKTVKIHTTLPEGGILVFVTGQREVNHLVRKLKSLFPLKRKGKVIDVAATLEESSDDEDGEERLKKFLRRHKKKKVKIVPEIDLDEYKVGDEENDSNDGEGFLSENEIDDDDDDVIAPSNAQPLWALPLYSFLPTAKQAEVFKDPPRGCRLCVVSTNVAETSLTIPNIKYVVDSGKTKIKLYDKITGVTSYVVSWTSKASANQRAGRAGRTAPGHCYRLYSSAVFNDLFQEFAVPEIQRKPIDDLYLQMKCMRLNNVVRFPFPTAPDLMQLKTAEGRLEALELLHDSKVTSLGRAVSKFPVLPRFGKMLALSLQHDLLPYAVCLVAALSVQEVLQETSIGNDASETREKWAVKRRKWAGEANSLLMGDFMVLLRAVGGAEVANFEGKLREFCRKNGLRHKAVLEIRKLRIQLTNEIKANFPDIEVVVDPKLAPPTDLQAKLLRQILLCGLVDQVAKKVTPDEIDDKTQRSKYKYAYRANDMEEPVFLHRGSVLSKQRPQFVVYQEIYETNRMYVRGIAAIEPEWLPVYAPKLCNLGKPCAEPAPWYDATSGKVKCMVSGTFGRQAWTLPRCQIEYPKSVDAYKFFAQFFLEGKVFGKLAKYSEDLLQPAVVVTKPWARLQPRIVKILNRLVAADCRNKEQVVNAWEKDRSFLLEEYLLWVPESVRGTVTLTWPPLDPT